MARSACIYLVTGPARQPIAGFTVKHELVTWLSRQQDINLLDVWKLGDGLHGNDAGKPLGMATTFLADYGR